jgi:hypothetical protein
MPLKQTKLTVEFFEAENACNLPALRAWFKRRGRTEFDVTPENIMRAHRAGVLATGWLAKRVLTGPDLEAYEAEARRAMQSFERRMAPVLARIVREARERELTPEGNSE